MRRSYVMTAVLMAAAMVVWSATLAVVAEAAVPTTSQQGPAAPAAEEQATAEKICSGCHEVDAVKGAFRMPEQWDETLSSMESFGLQATPKEMDLVRSFLLRNYGRARINQAPAKDLSPVLDVTPDVAEAVITYRRENGPLKTLDDLKKVPGMDPAKVDARKARLMF